MGKNHQKKLNKRSLPTTGGENFSKSPEDVSNKPQGRRAQLNLTLTDNEIWEFREWCVRHRIKQQDAFRMAFKLLKREET